MFLFNIPESISRIAGQSTTQFSLGLNCYIPARNCFYISGVNLTPIEFNELLIQF